MFNKEKPVQLNVDREKCINCFDCVNICFAAYLVVNEGKVYYNENSPFGCIQCGHCMAVCPNECIEIKGNGISKQDLFPLGDRFPDFESVNNLFSRRRSVRNFKKQEVSKEIIDKILESASTAPISVPPTEVKVLVINGFDRMQEFTDEMTTAFEKIEKFMNPFMLLLLRPTLGKLMYKFMKEFILPLFKKILQAKEQGKDILFFNAPALIMFNGTEVTDKEDHILASAHAQIAAEALGLGTCIIGSVPPILAKNKLLQEKYGIQKGDKLGMAFVLGYPNTTFIKGIRRHFNAISYYGD